MRAGDLLIFHYQVRPNFSKRGKCSNQADGGIKTNEIDPLRSERIRLIRPFPSSLS